MKNYKSFYYLHKIHFNPLKIMVLFLFFSMISVGNALAGNASDVLSPADTQQSNVVTGTITDKNGEVLAGVNVFVKGTSNGTVTDANGKFSLNVSSPNAVLVFSYIGYKQQEIPVSGKSVINVGMEENVQLLNDVVVVGYGTLKRSEVTAAVSTLKEKDFLSTPASSSVLELAKGKIPGVVITNEMGTDPRAGTSIQIRGVATLRGSTSPLIIIDGIPNGDLSTVQLNDVESFNVLKDASAAAIYGTRGANGVVLITTKKASRTDLKPQYEYSSFISHEYVYRRPEILSADEYREYMKAGGYNANMMVDYGANTDWPGLLINKDNISQNHNLSFSGGNAKNNYRASVFYKDMNPIAIRSKQSNWGGRLNINHLGLNDRLEVQMNVSTNFTTRDATGSNGAWEQCSQRNPTEPAKDENGKWLEDKAFNSWNPLANYSTQENMLYRTNWLGSGKVSLTIIDGLKASVMGTYQQSQENQNRYYVRDSKTSVDSYTGGGRADKWYKRDDRRTIETTLDFVRTFNNIHSFNAVVGHSFEYHVYEDFNAWNSGFLTDAFKYNNIGNGTGTTKGTSYANMGSTKRDDKLAAFFGRINYTLMDRYMLSGVFRYEGSSRFGANKRWGSFPAVSAGWILTKEDFMKDLNIINYLKLRGGIGVTGNIPQDNYLYMTNLSTGGQYPVGNTWYQTYGPARNPNPDLRWEKKTEVNIGFEYSLLNDRLSGTIDWYSRTTKDIIDSYDAQLPPLVLGTVWTNVGTINNNGIELGINASIIKSKDFSWDASATFFNQNNKLVSLSNDIYMMNFREWYGLPSPGNLGNTIRTQVGGALGQFYGKRFAGFDDNGKWLFYNAKDEKVPLADMKTGDLTYLGNGVPKYYASFTNTFIYKGFDLTVFFRGKFGYKILNLKDLYFGNLNWLPNNVLKSATTKNAQLHDAPQYSDYYLEKGDFVKLDNLTLGYTFKFKNQNWVRSLRVYATGQNLATFTKYSGTTPETQDTGFETGIEKRDFYPVASTLMFGLNIKF